MLKEEAGLASRPAAAEPNGLLKVDLATRRTSEVTALICFKPDTCPWSDSNEAYRTHAALRLLRRCVGYHLASSFASSDDSAAVSQ